MGLKYIYCGYSKCGTKTIAQAFRTLNFTVYDFEESVLLCARQWLQIMSACTSKKEKLDTIRTMFKDVDVVTDTPSYLFWELLMQAFPAAKCIFWAREETSWLLSFQRQMQVNADLSALPTPILLMLANLLSPKGKSILALQERISPLVTGECPKYIKSWTLETYQFSDEMLLLAYRKHNAHFLSNCPVEKRLILTDINCGWEPLCNFIGIPVPVTDSWPHQNKSCAHTSTLMGYGGVIRRVIAIEMKRRLTLLIGIIVSVVSVWYGSGIGK